VHATLVRLEGAPETLPELLSFGTQTSISIGRLESNQVVLNDRKISKVHCRMTLRTCKRKGSDAEIMRRVFAKDSSTFGTFVNGVALQKEQWSMLQEGDVVGLRNPHGNTALGEYRVEYFAEPESVPARADHDIYAGLDPAFQLGPTALAAPVESVPDEAGDLQEYQEPLSPLSELSEVSAASEPPISFPGMDGYGEHPSATTDLPSLQIESALAQSSTRPVVMTIPQELIGMLIGKGGETVKQLSKDSGARIEISKSDGPERTVYLSGSTECVERARQLIDDTLGKARERGTTNNPNACVIKVPHELVGMLIGKGGETIKDLKKESGARIDISKEPDAALSERLVHISGPPECVEFAQKMVEDMLGRARERQGDRSSFHDTATQTTIQVQQELIGMLIGKGGETIKSLSKDSGARIEISKEEGPGREDTRTVFLCGSQESLSKAKQMIDDTLSRARERQGDRQEERSWAGSKVHVAQELVGMLIGRGGETIKAIARDTGARIEISRDDRDSCERSVMLSGAQDAIDRAKDAINDVLSRARERLDGRADRADRRDLALEGEDSALVAYGHKMSPIKESYLHEKIYIDEVDLSHRPNFLPEHEDGLPTDLEIFLTGLPRECAERDLWEHLYRLGATDVKEILLLRRQKQSKGMAYVVFNRHDHAVLAKQKMNKAPAASISCGGAVPEETGTIAVWFSESERCINGRGNVYQTDMVGLLLGSKGKCMQQVKEESGLKKILLTGRSMKSYGQVDEDPRLHMLVYYEPDEVENVGKAITAWGEHLRKIHQEITVKTKSKGAGKGKEKGYPEWMFGWPPMVHPMMPPMELPVEAPVLLQRRAPGRGKVLEATCLRGRELRWQPWPEVSKFNEDWKAVPIRWNPNEMFMLLCNQGEVRVCAAQVHLPMERWPVLSTAVYSKSAKYQAFTFNEHLFLISIDRVLGILKVYHVPEPSAIWDVALETTLTDAHDSIFSRSAKLRVFYTPDRAVHVAVVEPSATERAVRIFTIADPGKAWVLCNYAPDLARTSRLLPVYTKTKSSVVTDFAVSMFVTDKAGNELTIFHVPQDMEKSWVQVSSMPFPGDTRFSCVYVPGKPEPLLMAGVPSERVQKLCHLNLVEWCAAKLDDRMTPPKAPVVEDKFSRQMSSLWPEGRKGVDELVVATPVDCTGDMPVSRHPWVTSPLLPAGPRGHEWPHFDRSPFDAPPWGFPPPFDPRALPFMRPPDMDGKGKGFPGRPFEGDHRFPMDRGHQGMPFDAPPGQWHSAQESRRHERPIEVGLVVEANYRDRGSWHRAKVVARHEDGTLDLQYEGEYNEWRVPVSHVRLPPEAIEDGRDRRRRRHESKDGKEGKEHTSGQRKRRRRHTRDEDRHRSRPRSVDHDPSAREGGPNDRLTDTPRSTGAVDA